MAQELGHIVKPLPNVINPDGFEPLFGAGDRVKVLVRYPIGHFRVPNYIRGKQGVVEGVMQPSAVNNEEEAYGRNAGLKRHYYRIGIPLTELWPEYAGSDKDTLRIEVFETWLEGAKR